MKHRLIYQKNNYRIIEVVDLDATFKDLAGDSFNPEYIKDIDPKQLEIDAKKFRQQIDDDGIFGYILQEWNPEVDQGWERRDSCFGFVGQYNEYAENYDHYIVKEMKQTILKELEK
jgi:hypothetical protein